jgi:hypothetical protein
MLNVATGPRLLFQLTTSAYLIKATGFLLYRITHIASRNHQKLIFNSVVARGCEWLQMGGGVFRGNFFLSKSFVSYAGLEYFALQLYWLIIIHCIPLYVIWHFF